MVYVADRINSQKGVALLIVLLLLVTLSAVAFGMTRTMRLSSTRAVAGDAVAQAQWYVQGAELLSTRLMEAQWEADPARDVLQDQWARQDATFPLEGGVMTARLRDNTVCFNVNSLVAGGEQERAANEDAIEEYNLLLSALGLDSTTRAALTDSLIDWLDTDARARPDGAEDLQYASLDVPYRAANTLLTDISELRSIYWYSREIYQQLRPYLCVHPSTQPSALNLNMVTEEKAPVLYAFLGGALSLNDVIQMINTRPEEGYASLDQFWTSHPELIATPPSEDRLTRPNLWSRYVRLQANINYQQITLNMTSLLEMSKDGTMNVIARKFGALE